jgi:hypothetical protein
MTTFGSKADKEGLMEWIRLTVQPTLQRVVAGADRRLCPVPPQWAAADHGPTDNGRSMWLTVMSLHVPDPCAVGQHRAREHGHRAILQVDDVHRVGGKEVGARGRCQSFKSVTRSQFDKH